MLYATFILHNKLGDKNNGPIHGFYDVFHYFIGS